ncbi:hypothetical protein WICPIJ_000266 [Wickerhamomyces pijperi]|uniref:Uncharacterized protein n=1 Tax=Wickerhamomyces pijperi TaxID=599730 RepID=A0A9P8TS97_WICPI|nr:hypothetical protein WICPIJ_000266 [Wickerhamomyces pijperi]
MSEEHEFEDFAGASSEEELDEEGYDDIDVDALMADDDDYDDEDYENGQEGAATTRTKHNRHSSDEEDEDDDDDEDHTMLSDGGGHSEADDDLLAQFTDEDENMSYEDDDELDFTNAIREANNFNVKKKSKGAKKFGGYRPSKETDPEIIQLLSMANDMFVQSDYDGAEKAFLEVVKRDPTNFPAYRSLGEISFRKDDKVACCSRWFMAAHMRPLDGEFWVDVARLSNELGFKGQASYCYSRALKTRYRDYEVLLERAILHRELGDLGKASKRLFELQSMKPEDPRVLKELALVYLKSNRVNDAIAMYLRVFEKNDEHRRNKSGKKLVKEERFPVFDFSLLNILAELFINQKNSLIAIRTIKLIARWIQNREDETFWEDSNDDSEFDERRYENHKFEALPDILKTRSHWLPIDLRVKLGFLRLSVNNYDEALVHYGFLLNKDVENFGDLFHEAATSLEEAQLFGDAIKFLVPLSKYDAYQTAETFVSMGKCYADLEKYEEAKHFFNLSLKLQPDNLDVELALVEVLYYLEEVDESQALLERITTRKRLSEQEENSNIDTQLFDQYRAREIDHGNDALIKTIIKPTSRKARLSEQEVKQREDRMKQNILEKFKRLHRLKAGLDSGDVIAIGAWLQIASELVDIFSNVKTFNSKDRSRRFKGILKRTRGSTQDFSSKIQRISEIYQGLTSQAERRTVVTSKTEFRGVTYEEWFDLFMEFAVVTAKYEQSYEDALGIVETAKHMNVFFQNKDRDNLMNLVKLSIVILGDDKEDVLFSLRTILNNFQFNKDVMKLFFLAQPSGKFFTEVFIAVKHQKYFLRQIKAWDSLRFNKHITGQSTITNKDLQVSGTDNPYLMYIYACLLLVNKSYSSSLVYLTRIYYLFKHEPIVNLLMGIAYLHRSMQRSSNNRHIELLQGLKYFQEYFSGRTVKTDIEKQEAYYNMGKVYHLLGLVTIAEKFYLKVLDDFNDFPVGSKDIDLKKITAYNLLQIYNGSGNKKLCVKLMEKYLTI